MQSEAKHTPGPWAFYRYRGRNSAWNPFVVYLSDGSRPIRNVAEMCSPHEDEDAANARLIAAAPDLLAACIAAENAILDRLGHDDPIPGIVVTLREAIRKAIGNA